MKRILLSTILLLALAGCETHEQVSIFPGDEAKMVAMCDPNGGFDSGYETQSNEHHYKSDKIKTYRTNYHVECKNGARIDKTDERPGEE